LPPANHNLTASAAKAGVTGKRARFGWIMLQGCVEVGLLEVFFDDQDDADVGEKLHRQCRPLFKARKLCQVAQALLGNDIFPVPSYQLLAARFFEDSNAPNQQGMLVHYSRAAPIQGRTQKGWRR
jgi:hypothetical protein